MAAPAAFILSAALLARLGRIPSGEAVVLGIAVIAAYLPGSFSTPSGWRRQAAEFLLLPAAWVLFVFGENTLRLMLLPPLMTIAAWSAWAACHTRRQRAQALMSRSAMVIATAGFGVSIGVLAALGKGLSPGSVLLHSLAGGVLATAGLALGSPAVLAGALAGALAPPLVSGLLLIPVFPLISFQGRLLESDVVGRLALSFRSLTPMIGGMGLFLISLSPWGLPPLRLLFPHTSWIGWLGLLLIALVSLRFPPAAAGALGVLACLLLGPAVSPIREGGRRPRLDTASRSTTLRPGQGGSYAVEISLGGARKVREGATVGWIQVEKQRIPLRVGREVASNALLEGSRETHAPPAEPVLRPPGRTGAPWRLSGRLSCIVPGKVVPKLERNSGIRKTAWIEVPASGPELPSPPRAWTAEKWLWAAAAMAALIQLLSGLWRSGAGALSWIPLIAGLAINRSSIQPLHLLGERMGVDLALAAFLLAWVPAAWHWSREQRFFLPAMLLLAPLAMATAELTPPLWGDEPYHLALLESIVRDHALNPAPYLLGGGAIREFILSRGHLFHSPILAFLLLPGYFIAGRIGAQFLMSVYAAASLALLMRVVRRSFKLPHRTEVLLFLMLSLSYPLTTFTGQIWPAILGILCTTAALLLVDESGSTPRGGAWAALALASLSGAIKTRLALISFPVALSAFRKHVRSIRFWLGLAAAALLSLGVGRIFLGHPFGAFRRLGNLLPTDPALACRVLCGLLFDGAGGLLWMAPFWIIALLALPRVWKKGSSAEKALFVGAAATVFFLLSSGEWYGGGSPPARYLVPLLPLIAISLAGLLGECSGKRRLLIFAAPPSFVAWFFLNTRPHFGINPGDGRWYFSTILSRAFHADAVSLFPSFLHLRPASFVVPAILTVTILLLWYFAGRRPAFGRKLAGLTPAIWLVLALAFTTTLLLRPDSVVEAEAAQVRHQGGAPFPSRGIPQRWAHRVGWSLSDNNSMDIPLHLREDDQIVLIARLRGLPLNTRLICRWDGKTPKPIDLETKMSWGALPIPGPDRAGPHTLSIRLETKSGVCLEIDRIEIQRQDS